MNKRILGGFDFADNGTPFAVYIKTSIGEHSYACGGTLIAPNVVLTAAHCMHGDSNKVAEPMNVTIGYNSDDLTKMNTVKAITIAVHPDYAPLTETTNVQNDIALIEIPEITLTDTVQTVPIYNGSISSGDELVAVGWGATVSSHDVKSLPYEIKGAVLKVGDDETCSQLIPDYESPNGPTICTLNKLSPGNSTCKGDSGSGVFVLVDNTPYLIGLSSAIGSPTTTNCGTPDGFGLYTNVRSYLDFITGVTSIDANKFLCA
ncbi:hypothetical protein GGI07_000384 [Coemansia sp. Benny D115]|nr:hypothetical protein GGI07_000384 [Coemansia sp. Benny D115]